VQVDGIAPSPVGCADPIPDATGELDDPRLAGHPAQAEQFADRRCSPVRSQYHEAKCATGKDDLRRRLHRGSRVDAVRTGCETHGRHGAQQAVTPLGDRRQRGSTVTCSCSTRCRAVAELRTPGPTSNSPPTNLNSQTCVPRWSRCPQSAMKYPQPVDKLRHANSGYDRVTSGLGDWCPELSPPTIAHRLSAPPVVLAATILAVPACIDAVVCAALFM
jgi:hypothetical protein